MRVNIKGALTILEIWFLRASALALSILILSQAALTSEDMRFFLCRVERFEGSPIAALPEASSPGWITLRCIEEKAPRDVKVLVNGLAVSDFDYGDAVIMVHHGDLVEIDGFSNPRSLHFEVIAASLNIEKPAPGTIVRTDKSIESLGNVSVNPLRTR